MIYFLMVMVMITTTMESDWGTWEELLLGGAVLRHGTGDWTVVAEELRSHSLPEIFTPEVCSLSLSQSPHFSLISKFISKFSIRLNVLESKIKSD